MREIGLEGDSLLTRGESAGKIALVEQGNPQAVVSRGVIRVESNGLLKRGDGAGTVALQPQGVAQLHKTCRSVRPQRNRGPEIPHRLSRPRRLEMCQQVAQLQVEPEVAGVLLLRPTQEFHSQP